MAKTNKGRKFFATTATAALVASAIVPVASAAQVNDFNSIASYAQEAVQDLVDRGVVQGDANGNFQPRKSVSRAEAATILTGALGLTTSDEVYFTDVKSGAWYYDAINSAVNNGVFAGKGAGIFEPNGNLTRGEAAIILVNAFNLDGRASLAQFSDEKSVKAWAVESLEIAVGNGVIKGDNGKIKANDAITKQDFAVMFSRAEAAAEAVAAKAVKVINNTTVEVTFPEAVTNLAELNFAIDGLTISNKVVKQTDSKTVVLTTSAQEGGKEYTVTVDGKSVGKFNGIAAVIPTGVNFTTYTEASKQGVIGKDVTLKAQVTVDEGQPKAGIPVTFNIVSENPSVNSKIEVVEYTDENGVASHTYTRYYSHTDNVAAYATQKSSVVSNAKVYWSNAIQLAVSEITAGNELANETKKTYKIAGAPNSTYQVAIQENINVAPDKVTQVKVQSHNAVTFVTPYQLSTGSNSFATVTTNEKGEGTFTVYGTNLSATPVVYKPETANNKYTNTALQASAPTVKFAQVDRLAISVVAEGTANSAEYATDVRPVAYNTNSAGGRTYTVTVTDKNGKVAPEGTTAYVTFEKDNIAGEVLFSTGTKNFVSVGVDSVEPITVGKDGKAQFRVIGKGATTFVKPTVFLNTAGAVAPGQVKLEKTGSTTDISQVSEVTYFGTPSVLNASLTVKDLYGRTVTSLNAGEDAYFTYQSVDQNGFAYRPSTTSGSTTQTVFRPVVQADGTIVYVQETLTIPGVTVYEYTLAFDVTSTFGNAEVKDALGVALPAVQNLGNTKTYNVKSDATGKAIVRVTSQSADTVSVNVTGASNILPTQTATVSFANSALVPDVYSGTVESYHSQNGTLKFAGKNSVSIFGSNILYTKGNEVIANYDAFIKLLDDANGPVSITRTVKDGVTTFNIYNIGTSGGGPVDTVVNPAPVFTSTTNIATANNIATLGLVGTTATSSDTSVASVTITGGNIAIKSEKAGTATVTVKNDEGHAATIAVVVNAKGEITLGAVSKYVAPVNPEPTTGVTVEALAASGALTLKANAITKQQSVILDSTKLPAELVGKELVLVVGTDAPIAFKVNQFKDTQLDIANTNYTEVQILAGKVQVK